MTPPRQSTSQSVDQRDARWYLEDWCEDCDNPESRCACWSGDNCQMCGAVDWDPCACFDSQEGS